MAVIAVYPGEAIFQPEGELDERAQRRYVVSWIVVTDDPRDGIQVVGDAPGLPVLYSEYIFGNDVDLGSTLKRIHPVRRPDTLTVWTVYLEYDSTLGHPDSGQREPTARRHKKQWSGTSYEIPFVVDLFGNPILNSAGDEFDPPAMRVMRGSKLVYTKNVATETEVGAHYSFLECTNEDTFQGFAPRTACMVDFDAFRDYDNATEFWQMTMVIEFRRIILNPLAKIHHIDSNGVISATPGPYYPWNKTILNNGLHRLSTTGGLISCVDENNKPVRQPINLRINGAQQPTGTPRNDKVYLSWEVSEQKQFSALGVI